MKKYLRNEKGNIEGLFHQIELSRLERVWYNLWAMDIYLKTDHGKIYAKLNEERYNNTNFVQKLYILISDNYRLSFYDLIKIPKKKDFCFCRK
jgi:hypothetical protein